MKNVLIFGVPGCKTITLVLVLALLISTIAACSGDYDESTPATSDVSNSVPDTAPSSTSISTAKPDPFFPNRNFSVSNDYTPSGIITGVTIKKEVRNRGGAGDVFVTVASEVSENLKASKVFYMESDESVVVEVYFRVNTPISQHTFKWEAYAASPDDVSQGEI